MENMDKIVYALENRLPELAKNVAKSNDQLPSEYKKRFLENLDSPLEHTPNWHQWGIVTHTLKFREFYDSEIQDYLKKWDLDSVVKDYLSIEIEGIPKSELIRIAIPLHDLGKFMKGLQEDGAFYFNRHEKVSQEIILESSVNNLLCEYGLTDSQIEYIAACAGNHYELGLIRRAAKESPEGYTISFTSSQKFKDAANQRAEALPDLKGELGLLFLGDSLAKTDIRLPATTDAEIDNHAPAGELEINNRNLNPNLIIAVRQLPVNIAVAKEYLSLVLNE